jgi:MFS transporter, FHS family, glucose/mannose:H+ symporter
MLPSISPLDDTADRPHAASRGGLAIRLGVILSYFVLAILLNSAGTVILQSINSLGVAKDSAAVLEAFKDLPIAIVSFLVASFLPRIGYRQSMMIGLGAITLACIALAIAPSFFMVKLLFAVTGAGFALIKVSVYSIIGLLTHNSSGHASFTNLVEGLFMVGVLVGYWLFAGFLEPGDPASLAWLNVYWVLAGFVALVVVLLGFSRLDETEAHSSRSNPVEDFIDMLQLMLRPLVLVFVISAFLSVLIEQGIGTWLPTFNNQVLSLPPAMSIQAASIFAVGLALGRLLAALALARIGWYPVLNLCLSAMAILVVLTLPLTQGLHPNPQMTWFDAPAAAFILPLVGVFMAPIYPAINSAILSSLPRSEHAAMMGLIVVFSALGGTTGSLIIGQIFGAFSGQTAFYLLLVPMAAMIVSVFFFKREIDTAAAAQPVALGISS